MPLKDPALEEKSKENDIEEDEEETIAPLSSLSGAFMDLVELDPLLLIKALFLSPSGDKRDCSGLCMTFVLLQSEPEHFIFLHFLVFSSVRCSGFCISSCFRCFCGGGWAWRCLQVRRLLKTAQDGGFSGLGAFWFCFCGVFLVVFLGLLVLAIGEEI